MNYDLCTPICAKRTIGFCIISGFLIHGSKV